MALNSSRLSTARSNASMSSTTSSKSKFSAGTQQLLESMMKDAGVNHRKAKLLKQAMEDTGALPTPAATPQGSMTSMSTMSSSNFGAKSRPLNPRTYDGGKKTAQKIALEVLQNQSSQPQQARRPGIDRDVEKQRLATIMQYEGNVPQVPQREVNTRTRHYAPPGSNQNRGVDEASSASQLQNRFSELTSEVEENQKFLRDMQAAGQGEKYNAIVNGNIAEKRREMEQIDKQLEKLGI